MTGRTMNMTNALVNVDDLDQDKLKMILLRLPAGRRVTIQGSGISVRARAGARRMFDLDIPMNVPTPPTGLELKSMKSATEASENLLKLHESILRQREAAEIE